MPKSKQMASNDGLKRIHGSPGDHSWTFYVDDFMRGGSESKEKTLAMARAIKRFQPESKVIIEY